MAHPPFKNHYYTDNLNNEFIYEANSILNVQNRRFLQYIPTYLLISLTLLFLKLVNGSRFWFVDREDREMSVRKHEMLEYGEYQGELYGTKLDSVREVIDTGRMCVLDCSPSALKLLHNSNEFMPFVVFLAAPGN